MSYQLVFHPKAEQEYLDAYSWYEDKQEGLGDRFEQMVERKLKQISEHPEHYAITKSSLSGGIPWGFPFQGCFHGKKEEETDLCFSNLPYQA